MGGWGWNSDLYVCQAGTLPTEPRPQIFLFVETVSMLDQAGIELCMIKDDIGDAEMAQSIKELATEPNDLISTSRTYMVKELTSACALWYPHAYIHTYTCNINKC